ncbi:MAG TPA: hypothetical protein PLE45_00710 [Spirochaetota bacterium]|nr:hypothetical protein [Spirochaetota bacterium]HOL56716.1 hypothetical protein [Spirochaetota bacterium]HPP04129.1 hypothetical protein [Spirochaetota bacterium]
MRKRILLFFLILILFSSCTDPKYQKDEIIKGIAISEDYYNEYSFIDYNTVKDIFNLNNIDFLLCGLHNKENSKRSFSNDIKNISKKLKNDKLVYNVPILDEKYYYDNPSDNQTIFFFDKNNNTLFNPYHREKLCNILLNLITLKYDGTTKNYFNKYIELLDKGYILGPSVSSEIIGPQWFIPGDLRMYIVKNNKESIQKAISKRRIYVSLEKDVIINFKIANYKIGEIINSFSTNILPFSLNIKSPNSKIGSVEIISNNNEIIFKTSTINRNEFIYNNNIELKNSFAYYMVKVQFNNGNIAFTTPIWIVNKPLCVINSIEQRPLTKKNTIKYTFCLENIREEAIEDLTLDIISSEKGLINSKTISLKKRETFYYSDDYTYENDYQEILTFHCYKDNFSFYSNMEIDKKSRSVSVLIDAAHNNIFKNEMSKLKELLESNNFIVSKEERIKFFEDYENLKKYHIILITIPENILGIMDQNMFFFVAINKYVYNGGIIVVAAYNHENIASTIVFMNEILRVVYSQIRFRIDDKFNVSRIKDLESNYMNNPSMPIFYNIIPLDPSEQKIEKIYMRNPVEFFSQIGTPINKLYNIEPLVIFNETTRVDSHFIKNYSDYSSAVISNFGSGKVVILSGINFSDYDIDNLNNKEWILSLFKYISKTN